MKIPVAKEGYPFILPISGVAAILLGLGYNSVGTFFLLLGLFTVYFFRDPERVVFDDSSLILSPADGKVVKIMDKTLEGEDSKEEVVTQVSIFLSVFNVHINRMPIKGEIQNIAYNKGKFMVAFAEKASLLNEQNAVIIKNQDVTVKVVQIAGLIARRIVCWIRETQKMEQGERFGLIRFGSRVDIFLPKNVEVNVSIGQKVTGGISVIGTIK